MTGKDGKTMTQLWSAEVTDPVTGEVTILHADSEGELELQVSRLIDDVYPLPVDAGAGNPANAAAVRQVLKVATGLVGASTRLVEVRNVDEHLVRIEIGCSNSPRLGDLQVIANLEQRLVDLLPGRWEASWHLAGNSLLLARTQPPA